MPATDAEEFLFGMEIAFAAPVSAVGGCFSSLGIEVTLAAFDASGAMLAAAAGYAGDNILLEAQGPGTAAVRVQARGGYDDVTPDDLTARTAAVPGPASLAMLSSGAPGLLGDARSRKAGLPAWVSAQPASPPDRSGRSGCGHVRLRNLAALRIRAGDARHTCKG